MDCSLNSPGRCLKIIDTLRRARSNHLGLLFGSRKAESIAHNRNVLLPTPGGPVIARERLVLNTSFKDVSHASNPTM